MEMMPLNRTREPSAFARADHVHALAFGEHVNLDFSTFSHIDFAIAQTKLAQITQCGQVVTLQMSEFALRQTLRLGFAKPQLNGGVAIFFAAANLRDEALRTKN